MSSPTLTFTPAMFHASKSGIKDTTRRVIVGVHAADVERLYIETRQVKGKTISRGCSRLAHTGTTFDFGPPPHQPGEIKPMVTTWAVKKEFDGWKPCNLYPGRLQIWFNDGTEKPSWCGKARPGRFLPKTLYALAPQVEILTVHPEFLHDITESSARREGISQTTKDALERGDETTWKYGLADRDGFPGTDDFGWPWNEWCRCARDAYLKLWDSINADRDEGQYAAAKNPAVWVITYRLIS
jgi:hypothetical protein